MDGYITIGTELDTKTFDAQITELRGKLEDLEGQKRYFELHGDVAELQDVEVEIEKTKNKIIGLNQQKAKLAQTQPVEAMGGSFRKAIAHAGKLALAIFGIRSAYMTLRQASSYLASYDKQYAANLEYIKYALTQVIAPVLKWIVSLAGQVLHIIGSIINALFGVNIFSNASAKSFQKMKAAAGGASKSAKELKKTLAGFDEMNVLQDNKDTGGGGGGAAPSFDLSKMEKIFDLNAFAKKVDEVLGVVDEKFVEGSKKIRENVSNVLSDLGFSENFIMIVDMALKGIEDLISGFIKVVRGVLDIILGFITGDTELVKQGFSTLVKGLGQMFQGLMELIWAGIDALVLLIVTAAKTLWDVIVSLISTILSAVSSFVVAVWSWIYNHIVVPVGNFITSLIKKVGEALKSIYNAVKEKFTQIKTFVTNVIQEIIKLFKTVGTKVGDAISGSFKAVVNAILGGVENILNNPVRAVNDMIDKINTLPGINVGWKLQEFHLPRLAKGGLVNMPGTGTLVGNAIAGERGVEGVIPLTDNQAMEQLGEAIGRYITINASIVNKMNGRTISRELQKIKSNQDFSYNL